MKRNKEHSLLYHTMHSRPMPGCLPLFFLLALLVTGVLMWYTPVRLPERVRSKAPGEVYVKNGRLADFLLRRNSPLPLHLPMLADPEYQEDAAAASMHLVQPVKLQTPPRAVLFDSVAHSVVLNEANLLALPGEESSPAAEEPAVHADAPEAPQSETVAEPVFHPGVDKEEEADGEEVTP